MSEASAAPPFDLSNRVAVVTGGAGVLGRTFAQAYAAYGADVVLLDIDEERVRDAAADLAESHGRRSLGIECDISDPRQVASAAAQVAEAFGPVRILHNNAANQSRSLKHQFARFEDYSLEDWRRVMSVDVDGTFLVTQAFGSAMARSGLGGSIILTSSIYGHFAPDNRIYADATNNGQQICSPAVYSAAKAATVALTRWLATYWADAGIRANVIVPGGIRGAQNRAFVEKYAARVPLNRMGEPNDLIGAALFLASDAASYVTGQCLFVDGGLSAW